MGMMLGQGGPPLCVSAAAQPANDHDRALSIRSTGGPASTRKTVSVSCSIGPFEGAFDHGSTRCDGTDQGSRTADYQVSLLDLGRRRGAIWTHRLRRGFWARARPVQK